MFELPTAVLLISVLLIWGSPLRFVIVSDIPLAGYPKGIDCGGGLLGKSPSYPWTWLIKADLEVQPFFFPKGTVPQYPSLSCPGGMRKQINRIEPIHSSVPRLETRECILHTITPRTVSALVPSPGQKPTTKMFGSTGCPLHGPLQDGYSMLCVVEHSATRAKFSRLSLWGNCMNVSPESMQKRMLQIFLDWFKENHAKVVFPEAQVRRFKVGSPSKQCCDTSRKISCHQTIDPCVASFCAAKRLNEHYFVLCVCFVFLC